MERKVCVKCGGEIKPRTGPSTPDTVYTTDENDRLYHWRCFDEKQMEPPL